MRGRRARIEDVVLEVIYLQHQEEVRSDRCHKEILFFLSHN